MKMHFVLSLIMVLFSCCSKEEHLDKLSLKVMDFNVSGCKQNLKTTSSNNEVLTITMSGGELTINHQNVLLNCCPDEIGVDAFTENNSITIHENTGNTICNCVCPYDVAYKVGKLTEGDYTLNLYLQGQKKTTFQFDSKLDSVFHINIP